MITLKIGKEERQNGNIENCWIAHQLQKRNGQAVCIRLVIKEGDVNAGFSSAYVPVVGVVDENRTEKNDSS